MARHVDKDILFWSGRDLSGERVEFWELKEATNKSRELLSSQVRS